MMCGSSTGGGVMGMRINECVHEFGNVWIIPFTRRNISAYSCCVSTSSSTNKDMIDDQSGNYLRLLVSIPPPPPQAHVPKCMLPLRAERD